MKEKTEKNSINKQLPLPGKLAPADKKSYVRPWLYTLGDVHFEKKMMLCWGQKSPPPSQTKTK